MGTGTTADKVWNFGPLIGLTWLAPDGEHDKHRVWVERIQVEYLRTHLIPARPPTSIPESCWLWIGPMTSDGRPMMTKGMQFVPVRRLLYDLRFGPLPGRDYLIPGCGVPRCCNPAHQKIDSRGPLTRERLTPQQRQGVNVCAKGHPLTPANTYQYKGQTYCRTCRADNSVRYRSRRGAGR